MTIEFDNKDSAHQFFASWLDGGLDGGGNLDWDTTKWKDYNYMRIEGTGCPIEWEGNEMIVVTPEVEEARMEAAMKKYNV